MGKVHNMDDSASAKENGLVIRDENGRNEFVFVADDDDDGGEFVDLQDEYDEYDGADGDAIASQARAAQQSYVDVSNRTANISGEIRLRAWGRCSI
jgi:hypothetical protein